MDQTAHPPVVDRATFEKQLAAQVVREKALTRLTDTVSAARRRLPMVEVENYRFEGPVGEVTLLDLFGDHDLLVLQNVMYAPDWDEGCPSCTYAVDTLPADMGRLDEVGIAFALVSQAPVEKLEAWRTQRGWPHRWVSSGDTTFHHDWGWTLPHDGGEGPVPGYAYFLRVGDTPHLTYATRARGVEAVLPVVQIQDRTCFGRQQEWEDSPEGWPQRPTYG